MQSSSIKNKIKRQQVYQSQQHEKAKIKSKIKAKRKKEAEADRDQALERGREQLRKGLKLFPKDRRFYLALAQVEMAAAKPDNV